MIHIVDLGSNAERVISVQDLKDFGLQSGWLQLINPSTEELSVVAQKTGISMEFLELPKISGKIGLRLEQDFTIVNFASQAKIADTEDAEPIILAFSKSILVTVEKQANAKIFETVKERMSKAKVDPPGLVAYFIIDEIVSNHFDQLKELEELTSKIEEQVVEKTNGGTMREIFRLKSKLISFNKLLWYERGVVFNLKTCGDQCMAPKTRDMFNTTHEDLTRQIDIIETYREIMSDGINVHLSAVSNRINLSIKALTVVIFYLTIITTITSFPNTVATFFGIGQFGQSNVLIIAVALLLSIVLPLVWLWRKNWLRYDEARILKEGET